MTELITTLATIIKIDAFYLTFATIGLIFSLESTTRTKDVSLTIGLLILSLIPIANVLMVFLAAFYLLKIANTRIIKAHF